MILSWMCGTMVGCWLQYGWDKFGVSIFIVKSLIINDAVLQSYPILSTISVTTFLNLSLLLAFHRTWICLRHYIYTLHAFYVLSFVEMALRKFQGELGDQGPRVPNRRVLGLLHWSPITALGSGPLRLSLLTIIMSSERPSETNRIRKIAGSVKGKLSSLLHLSRAPTPSSIEVVPNSDNRTLARWATEFFFFQHFIETVFVFFRISPLNVTPVVQVGDHKPTTAFAAEAYSLSPSTGLLIPVSVPKQIGSTSAPSTVSDYAAVTIVITNYWSFSTCLRSAAVHCPPLHLIPSCKQSRNWNEIPLWVPYTICSRPLLTICRHRILVQVSFRMLRVYSSLATLV